MDEAGEPEPSFGMLETVREYAWEQLVTRGELVAASRAHAYYFIALSLHADARLHGSAQRMWYLRLERERDNLRAALRWLLDQDGPEAHDEHAAALRLAGALGDFWWLRGYHAEGARWLGEALARTQDVDRFDLAVRTQALFAAGAIFAQQRRFDRSQAVLKEALTLARRREHPLDTARALNYLGMHEVYVGNWTESVPILREALRRSEALGDSSRMGMSLLYLGIAASGQGNTEQAVELHLAALERYETERDMRMMGAVRCNLASLLEQLGDIPRAVQHLRAGLELSKTLQDRRLLSMGAGAMVILIGERGDPTRRARLLGAVDALFHATGATLGGWERLSVNQRMVYYRDQLEQEGWGAAYQAGRTLSFEQVISLALALLDDFA